MKTVYENSSTKRLYCSFLIPLAAVISNIGFPAWGFVVSGAVKTTGDESVAGAEIVFTNEANTNEAYSDITDDEGRYRIDLVNDTAVEEAETTPSTFQLYQNYPNPFNSSTVITYSLPDLGYTKIEIYNNLGQRVRTLVDAWRETGFHSINWDGRDDSGKGSSAGVYFYKLTSGGFTESRKMVLSDGASDVRRYTGILTSKSIAVNQLPTYRVAITGPGITPFEQVGVVVREDTMVDFVVEPDPSPVEIEEEERVFGPGPWENLVDEVEGFGRNTTGGKGGYICWVTNLDDDGPGSLRDCAQREGTIWVMFKVSGTIRLTDKSWHVRPTNNTTIDGRGVDITIVGQGIAVRKGVQNVIINNLKFSNHESDGVSISKGASNVWVHHVTIKDSGDENIEIVENSNNVTISWSKFINGNSGAALLGGWEKDFEDRNMKVTMHHNYFYDNRDRNPRVRFGKVHLYNNLVENVGRGVIASMEAQVYSEHNMYGQSTHFALSAFQDLPDTSTGFAKSVGDYLFDEAKIFPGGEGNVFEPSSYYNYNRDSAGPGLANKIRSSAGWQNTPAPL